MAKRIITDETMEKLLRGVTAVYDAVSRTIGPKGRNVAIDKGYGTPTITNDGVSIAKQIELKDKAENVAASVIKEVASKTNDAVGDGTSTATVLTYAIFKEGLKYVTMGVGVMGVKKGIDAAKDDVVAELDKMAKKVASDDEIAQVATISAESEELGSIIAEVIKKVGKDGIVTVEESPTMEMSWEVVEGFSFDRGYISPYMVTDSDRMEAVLEDVPVLITSYKISNIQSILPLLEAVVGSGKKDLLIVADDVTSDALATLVVNKLRGTLNVVAVKAPGFGDRKKEMLEDIAIATGGTVVAEEKGMKLEDSGIDVLGRVSKAIVRKDMTILMGGKGSKSDVEARIAQLKTAMQNTKSSFDKEKLQERIARLSGGVAVIKVGASTESEAKYLKLKVEDAVNATQAAIEGGIVQGGGSALVLAADRVAKKNKKFSNVEEEIGYKIVLSACNYPLMNIAKNAGKGDGSSVVAKVLEMGDGAGYDAKKDEFVEDMIGAGIIDPAKVSKVALTNAVSAAGTLLTTSCIIHDEPVEKQDGAGGAPMM